MLYSEKVDAKMLHTQFTYTHTHTHTHTHLTALCPGLPRWAGTRKVKRVWILLKQETVSGSGIIWAICKSAPCSRQTTTLAPHYSVFLQAGCPSCHPTNSVKALKIRALKVGFTVLISKSSNTESVQCIHQLNCCQRSTVQQRAATRKYQPKLTTLRDARQER